MEIKPEVEKILRENGFEPSDHKSHLWYKRFGKYNAVCFIDLNQKAVFAYEDNNHIEVPQPYKNMLQTIKVFNDDKQGRLF